MQLLTYDKFMLWVHGYLVMEHGPWKCGFPRKWPFSYSTQLWKMAHLYCRWLTYRKWWSSTVFNGFHGFSIAMLTSHCRLPEGNLAPGLCSPCRSLRKHQRHDAVATSRRNDGRFNGSSSVLIKIRKKTWVRNPKINMESNFCIVMIHYGVHEAPK